MKLIKRITVKMLCVGMVIVTSTVGSHAHGLGSSADDGVWSYAECVAYAKANNIKLQQSVLSKELGLTSLEAAKAQWFPTLNFATTQGFSNFPRPVDGARKNVYSGSYGLNAGWTVYDGNSRGNSIKKSELETKIDDLSIETIYNNLETGILTSYLKILYTKESIEIANQTLEVSKTQMERAKQLMDAGKMSRVDYSQLESQYHTDLYNVVSAQSEYSSRLVELKQLLELGINDGITLKDFTFTQQEVLQPLAEKSAIYQTALTWMPELQSAKMQNQVSDYDIKIAQSGKKPKISLNGSIGTSNGSGTGYGFGDQLLNGLNEQIGVTLSYNILDNKATKVAVSKAKIAKLNAELDYKSAENSLSQSIESAYIEARSSQAKYVSGLEQVKSAELTDELTNEQFKLGLVNTLDLLSSHSKLLNARQELLQSKYMAILSIKLLDFYQNKGITLP